MPTRGWRRAQPQAATAPSIPAQAHARPTSLLPPRTSPPGASREASRRGDYGVRPVPPSTGPGPASQRNEIQIPIIPAQRNPGASSAASGLAFFTRPLLRAPAASCLASCVAARLGSARSPQSPPLAYISSAPVSASSLPSTPPPPPPRLHPHSASPSPSISLSRARARHHCFSDLGAASPRAPRGCDLTGGALSSRAGRLEGGRERARAPAGNGVIGGWWRIGRSESEAMRRALVAPERRLPLLLVVALLALAAAPRLASAVTDAADVAAINGLYISLGSPTLPGWTGNGGDPCGEQWQGIVCTGSAITGITMNAANLGGQLGSLGKFTSIIIINLSNNKIGGTIPEDLPITLQQLFLSANQLTGSIPSSLSKLKNLTAMSVNANNLNGDLPDAFDSLNGLVNFDFSSNNLTGVLPPSMKSLASLTTLHMQDNQLSGTLNVLQDLPLKDLNIENNQFSGPIPASLLNIPNFKKDGNPFNTSIAPSASPPSPTPTPAPTPASAPTSSNSTPPPAPTSSNSTPPSPPPSSPSRAPPPSQTTSNSSEGSTTRDSTSSSKKHNTSTLKVVGFVLLGVVLFIITVLLVLFCISKYEERQSRYDRNRSQLARVHNRVEPQIRPAPVQQRDDVKKGSGEELDRRARELNSSAAALPQKSPENQKEHVINFDRTDSDLFPDNLPPPPPPPPLPSIERVVANPIVPPEKIYSPPPRTSTPTSAKPFSVASLQQYTNSFREDNVIRESRLGKVYLAELPDGKLLEVVKIDNPNGRISVDDFLERVESISEIKHPNILELVGYCAEYGQRLLVYNHFSRTTLDDALHDGEDTESALSWNARLQVALGSGKALEYLHESFQPPIVHQHFEPDNVLLDKKFSVCVAECGLAELMPSSSVTQLSGRMRALVSYEAPEFQDSGAISERGDVYSFGVVMLELLTGRKPYDSSRPRHEQHLVRWASSQLHDIESLSKMVDPSISGQCSEKALSRFADIISRCIQRQPEFRPPISEIVQDLARLVNATGEESE